jgi:hypothetical protein
MNWESLGTMEALRIEIFVDQDWVVWLFSRIKEAES